MSNDRLNDLFDAVLEALPIEVVQTLVMELAPELDMEVARRTMSLIDELAEGAKVGSMSVLVEGGMDQFDWDQFVADSAVPDLSRMEHVPMEAFRIIEAVMLFNLQLVRKSFAQDGITIPPAPEALRG